MKSKIKNIKITIDKAITILVLNFVNFYFVKFCAILTPKIRENERLFLIKVLPNY